MNFTREPIIETIVSPKEGYKLLVRNSKGENFEEYYVDAVEVVSFGRAFFFRSMERPKAFLVPVSDYEILEVKEARVALKNASHEKNIKIGGGREAPMRPAQREPREIPPSAEDVPAAAEETAALDTAVDSRMDRKRDRRGGRHRRRGRGHEERGEMEQKPQEHREREAEGRESSEEESKGHSLFSSLIPPPPTLISETLSRYREKEATEHKEHEHKEHEHKEHHKEHENKEHTSEDPPETRERDEDSGADSTPLHRVSAKEDRVQEVTSFNSTYFMSGGNDHFF